MPDEGQLPVFDPTSRSSPELELGDRVEHVARVEPIEGVVIATLVGVRDGAALIHHLGLDDDDACVTASTAHALTLADLGAELAVVFLGGDPDQPLVLGKLERFGGRTTRNAKRELVLEAERKITLRCGRSSITLSRDGRIEIRGQHLLSRAASVNRIRGGVIQLN